MTAADVLITVLLVCSMTALGLELTPEGLRRAFERPGALAWALVANVAVLPALAWLVSTVTGAVPALMAALILASACPGGGTGALLVRIARADGPTGASVMLLLSLSSTLTAPSVAAALVPGDVNRVELAVRMLRSLVLLQFAPTVLAALLRHAKPDLAKRLQPIVSTTGTVLLLALVGVLVWREGGTVMAFGAPGFLDVLILVVASVAIALPMPRIARGAVIMVSCVRNLSAALMLAALCLKDTSVTTGVLVYGLVMYVVALALVPVVRGMRA